MGARRAFGTVRKLPSGRWQALYLHAVSRQRVTAPSTFRTKAEADRWLAVTETDLNRGDLLSHEGQRVLFGDYADTWLAGKENLRPKTLEVYRYLLRVHILPTFESLPIGRIDVATVRSWHSRLGAHGLAKATTAKAYRVLRQILSAAVDDCLLRENPCRVVGAASERSAERRVPSLDEVVALAEAIAPPYRAMVLLSGFCGLRRGECLGLARRHLLLDARPPVVIVERSLVHLSTREVLQDPKTVAGRRRLVVPAAVAAELAAHLEEFCGREPDALVFPAPGGGLMSKASWRRIWSKAVAATGYEGTFHDLRHVAGTLNAAVGATLKEAMARLGHVSPHAALRYQHGGQATRRGDRGQRRYSYPRRRPLVESPC